MARTATAKREQQLADEIEAQLAANETAQRRERAEALARETFGLQTNKLSSRQRTLLKNLRRWTLFAEDDQQRIDEAAGWVSPEALSFGVSELACRAVIALARERDESPQTVARSLLGLPAA